MIYNSYKTCSRYQLNYIIDPFYQDHHEDWAKLRKLCPKIGIIGDDLTVTNHKRIKKASEKGACTGICVRMSQIGTVTDALRAIFEAKKYNWNSIICDRAGETDDVFIADLAVGVSAGLIHSGGLTRYEGSIFELYL